MAVELLMPEHELFPSQDQIRGHDQACCFGCGEWLDPGPTYSCRHCRILLHENCAVNLPTTIPNHPFHRKHPLELVANPTQDYKGKSRCIFCFSTINGILTYRCSVNCDLTLHVKCATSPKFTVGNFPEYDHFGHQHPLVSFQNHTDESAGFRCVICEESLTGPIHGCIECVFRLHTKCLDIPTEIHHRSHRRHRLLLQVVSFTRLGERICDVCDHPCGLVVYNCPSCDFDIHVNCASPPPMLSGEIHPHSLDLLLRICQFLCDGCGRLGEGAPYLCRKCNLVLHKECVSLPRISRVKQHPHPLAHKFSLLPEEISHDSIKCQLCRRYLNPKHGCYCCSETDCNYVAHVRCAIDLNSVDRSSFIREKPRAVAECSSSSSAAPAPAPSQECSVDDSTAIDRRNQLPLLTVLEWETTQDGLKIPTKIKHSCHNKELIRGGQVPSDEIQCFACLKPVIDKQYFSCSDCKFFLHGICAFQPREFKHWLHNHTLSLRYAAPFLCATCRYESTGFYYVCEVCRSNSFLICLRCKLIPEVFTTRGLCVQGHVHSLSYDYKYEDHTCNGCGNICGEGIGHGLNFRAFRCRDCDLFVDFPCLVLSKTARHEYHHHPLTLSFEDSEHDPARCVCNICDEYRDSKHWFYSCKECESTPSYFKAHCNCVLGKYPFIKIWSQFDGRPAHQHPLTVYRVNDYPQCGKCKDYIEEVALKCEETECNYALHWECLLSMSG